MSTPDYTIKTSTTHTVLKSHQTKCPLNDFQEASEMYTTVLSGHDQHVKYSVACLNSGCCMFGPCKLQLTERLFAFVMAALVVLKWNTAVRVQQDSAQNGIWTMFLNDSTCV